jgi:hypothetical protein
MQTAAQRIAKLRDTLAYLTPDEQLEVDSILSAETPIWMPLLSAPQQRAFDSQADVVFFGGAAGGAKSDLLLGLALTQHQRSIVFRRQATQIVALVDRMAEILRTRNGWNGQSDIWRLPDRQVEFGACKDAGDEIKYQGRPHDFVGFDEITHFLESQFRFLIGWMRTTNPKQRCRVVCAGNPPTDADGAWVIQYWGPWLDPQHPHPAKPGELRWYAMIDGKETEVSSGEPFFHGTQRIRPLSRTFIPSRVQDNPFLMETGYEATLQALPEPLRSQMLSGDFRAGLEDSEWQVIPTAWIEDAVRRWTPEGKVGFMDSTGVDVARGGMCKTIISNRFGNWFAPLLAFPGSSTPDGASVAGLVVSNIRDGSPVHVDVIGVGGSVYDHLRSNNLQVIPINGAESADPTIMDKTTGRLKFRNKRAQLWWTMRESLDPKIGDGIALPPDTELKADLCAPLWKLTPGGIIIESKEEIIDRLGRSPDKGDAVVMCNIRTPKSHPRNQANWRDHAPKGGTGRWSTQGNQRGYSR